MKIFAGFFVVLFFAGCLESEHSRKPLIGDFIKSEMERLKSEKPMVTKIAILSGKSDTIITDSLDWSKELNVFLMNDLDSSQLVNYDGSFSKDSLSSGQFLEEHRYFADNGKEKIKGFEIKSLNGIIEYIEIVVQKKHELFTYYKKLIYNSKTGYDISGSQNIKFIDGIDYKVTVNFK